MQIELDILVSDEEQLKDFYDIIAIELRKLEETFPCEEAKKQPK